ncbi:hypothetical protein Aduo_019677 [Ancylostoma duodenale]
MKTARTKEEIPRPSMVGKDKSNKERVTEKKHRYRPIPFKEKEPTRTMRAIMSIRELTNIDEELKKELIDHLIKDDDRRRQKRREYRQRKKAEREAARKVLGESNGQPVSSSSSTLQEVERFTLKENDEVYQWYTYSKPKIAIEMRMAQTLRQQRREYRQRRKVREAAKKLADQSDDESRSPTFDDFEFSSWRREEVEKEYGIGCSSIEMPSAFMCYCNRCSNNYFQQGNLSGYNALPVQYSAHRPLPSVPMETKSQKKATAECINLAETMEMLKKIIDDEAKKEMIDTTISKDEKRKQRRQENKRRKMAEKEHTTRLIEWSYVKLAEKAAMKWFKEFELVENDEEQQLTPMEILDVMSRKAVADYYCIYEDYCIQKILLHKEDIVDKLCRDIKYISNEPTLPPIGPDTNAHARVATKLAGAPDHPPASQPAAAALSSWRTCANSDLFWAPKFYVENYSSAVGLSDWRPRGMLVAVVLQAVQLISPVKRSSFAPYETVLEAVQFPLIRVLPIIAEGVPENQAGNLIKVIIERGVTLIGPGTVGGVRPGCFRIGNTRGMTVNILSSLWYRPGCIAYVSGSGGLSIGLNNII